MPRFTHRIIIEGRKTLLFVESAEVANRIFLSLITHGFYCKIVRIR